MQFLQQALDDPDAATLRPVLGVHRRAAGAGRAAGGRDRRRRPAVLPRPGRGRRAAQAVGEPGCPTARARSRFLAAGPGAGVRRRPGLEHRTGRAVAGRPAGAAGDPGRDGRGAEALVEDLGPPGRGGGHAVAPVPDLGRLGGRAHRHGRPAAAGRRARGERPAAECGQRLGRPGHGPALPDHPAARRGLRRSGAAGRRHHPHPLDRHRGRRAAGRGRARRRCCRWSSTSSPEPGLRLRSAPPRCRLARICTVCLRSSSCSRCRSKERCNQAGPVRVEGLGGARRVAGLRGHGFGQVDRWPTRSSAATGSPWHAVDELTWPTGVTEVPQRNSANLSGPSVPTGVVPARRTGSGRCSSSQRPGRGRAGLPPAGLAAATAAAYGHPAGPSHACVQRQLRELAAGDQSTRLDRRLALPVVRAEAKPDCGLGCRSRRSGGRCPSVTAGDAELPRPAQVPFGVTALSCQPRPSVSRVGGRRAPGVVVVDLHAPAGGPAAAGRPGTPRPGPPSW